MQHGQLQEEEDELTFVKVGCSSWCLSRISLPSLSPSFADSSPPPTTLNFFFKHGENAYPPAFHPPPCRRTATVPGTRRRTAACAESRRTRACKIEQGRRCRGEGGAVVCFISFATATRRCEPNTLSGSRLWGTTDPLDAAVACSQCALNLDASCITARGPFPVSLCSCWPCF